MANLDVTPEDVKALRMCNVGFEKAIFPMIEGSEVTNLASSRARLSNLAYKIDRYLKELDEETAAEMAKKAMPNPPKDPIKKDK